MTEATARSSRGRQRRALLVSAAAEVLMERGFAAVSHRSVAQRAGVALAATTYYFDSLEDLLAEAMRELADRWLATARDVLAALPAQLRGSRQVADAVGRVVAPAEDAVMITVYERYLEAARHGHLRATIAEYDGQLDVLLADVLRRGGLDSSPATARLVLAAVDGASVRALAEGQPLATVLVLVRQLIDRLEPAQS